MFWGISTEWWVLYFLILGSVVLICARLRFIHEDIIQTGKAVTVCAQNSHELTEIDMSVSKIKDIFEANNVDHDEISVIVDDIRNIINERMKEER